METDDKKPPVPVTPSSGNMFLAVAFILMFFFTNWLQLSFWYYCLYTFMVLNILFLFRSFPVLSQETASSNRGLFFTSFSFISLTVICFANIYQKQGLLFQGELVTGKREAFYYSLCNLVNRGCDYSAGPSCAIEAAFETLLGMAALAYLVAAFVQVVRSRN